MDTCTTRWMASHGLSSTRAEKLWFSSGCPRVLTKSSSNWRTRCTNRSQVAAKWWSSRFLLRRRNNGTPQKRRPDLNPQAPTSRSRNDGIDHLERAVDHYVNLVGQSQQYHLDDAVSSSSERNIRISPFRRRCRASAHLPATLHGDARQLGSACHRRSRVRTRTHLVRQRGHRSLNRQGPRDDPGNGGTCARLPRRTRLRTRGFAWIFPRWHGRASYC